MTTTITYLIEAEWLAAWGPDMPVGNTIEIEVTLGIRWKSNGIGAYDYWGQKCFDDGDLEPEEYVRFAVSGIYEHGKPTGIKPSKALCEFAETWCDQEFDLITDGLTPEEEVHESDFALA